MNYKMLSLVVISLLLPIAQARPLAQIKASKVIYLGADPTYRPFFYQENDVNKGFEYEIGQEIARRMGVAPRWKLMDYADLKAQVVKDNIDLNIASNSIYAPTLKELSFSEPHYCSGAVILSKMNKPVGVKQIGEAKVVYSSDNANESIIKKITSATRRTKVKNDDLAVSQLAFGSAEAYIGDQFVALDTMKRFPSMKFQMTAILDGTKDTVGMGTQKNNTSLITEVNKILKEMMADGTYQKISTKYFGKDVRCK